MNSDLRRLEHLPRGKDLYIGEEGRAAHQVEIQRMADTLFDGTPGKLKAVMAAFVELLAKEDSK